MRMNDQWGPLKQTHQAMAQGVSKWTAALFGHIRRGPIDQVVGMSGGRLPAPRPPPPTRRRTICALVGFGGAVATLGGPIIEQLVGGFRAGHNPLTIDRPSHIEDSPFSKH